MRKSTRMQHFARNSLCGCLRIAKLSLQEAVIWAGRLKGQKRMATRLSSRSKSLDIELKGMDALATRLRRMADEIDVDLQTAVGIPVLPEEKAAAKIARKVQREKKATEKPKVVRRPRRKVKRARKRVKNAS